MNVIYVLMLLFVPNCTYVHCLRNGRSKVNGIEKKLLSDAQNSRSFADISWVGSFGRILNIFGTSTHDNPWKEYMKHFEKPNNHTIKPIKGAHFGEWNNKDGRCNILKGKKINESEPKKDENINECATKLLSLNNTEKNKELKDSSKTIETYWANWDPTDKCLIYKLKPNCLLHKSDGYAFTSYSTINFQTYDLPPCINDSNGWKISAKCGKDDVEKTYECKKNKWVLENTENECIIENKAEERVNEVGNTKEKENEVEDTKKTVKEAENREIGEKQNPTEEEPSKTRDPRPAKEEPSQEKEEPSRSKEESSPAKEESNPAKKESSPAKEEQSQGKETKTEEKRIQADQIIDPKEAESTEEIDGKAISTKKNEKENQESHNEIGNKLNQTLSETTEYAQQNIKNVVKSEEIQNILKDVINTVEQEEKQEMEKQAKDAISNEPNKIINEIDKQEIRAKKKINETELNPAEKLNNRTKHFENDFLDTYLFSNISELAKNGTTSSGDKYSLTRRAVDITLMLVIASFVL